MSRNSHDEPAESATLQKLRGGNQWHCADVACSWVASAELELAGETKEVHWDEKGGALQLNGEEETMGLSNVCNRCRAEKGWTPFWLES